MLTMGPQVRRVRGAARATRARSSTRSPSRPARPRCTSPCSRSASARATRCSSPPTRSRRPRTSSRSPALKPVLVDVDPETMNLDPARLERSGRGRRRSSPCTSSAGRSTGTRCEELPDAAAPRGRGRRARRALPRPRRAAGSARSAASASTRARSSRPARAARSRRTTTALAERVRAAPQPRLAPVRPHADMPRAGPQLPALGHPLRASASRSCARLDELLAARERVAAGYERAPRATCRSTLPRRPTGDVHGWQAYVLQARPPRRGARRRCARRGSRRRSARTRSTGSAPTATRARSRARTAPSSGRSRSRSTRADRGELDRVAEALDTVRLTDRGCE